MYAGTVVNWHDNSGIREAQEIPSIVNRPLFMVVSSFDKGPEKLMEVEGEDFNKLFGTVYYAKHGQNGIQAQNIINAGGRLLVKRIVAEDATISNLVLVATVTEAEGKATISWETKTYEGLKTFSEVKEKALAELDEANGKYPLFVISDNGRGTGLKSVRINPDYNTSKGSGRMFYSVTVYEGTGIVENQVFTADPSIVYSDNAYGLTVDSCEQVIAEIPELVFDAYVTKLATITGLDAEVIKTMDVIFGYTNKGGVSEKLEAAKDETGAITGIDLNATYGIELKSGTNGIFGDAPAMNSEDNASAYQAWTDAMIAVYEGTDAIAGDEVWDVDQHKIFAIVDANLPVSVKESIAKFMTFREDGMFFRDIGIGKTTLTSIQEALKLNETKNKFIADYGTSYMIKDPLTMKTIEVTMMYDFVECLVNLYAAGPFNPAAGFVNGFVLKSAIKGTINYTPIVTPKLNQKQVMDDLRLNFAIFEDNNCVVQSLYTSQEANTELSYINNVLGIQEVVRQVRRSCPRQRFTLVKGADLSDYAAAVKEVLRNYTSNFAVLNFIYTKDPLKSSQKIFNAVLEFAFNEWAQTEVFDVYAINTEISTM